MMKTMIQKSKRTDVKMWLNDDLLQLMTVGGHGRRTVADTVQHLSTSTIPPSNIHHYVQRQVSKFLVYDGQDQRRGMDAYHSTVCTTYDQRYCIIIIIIIIIIEFL